MIARVSEARYIETSGLTLARKIEYTLDEVFKIINVKRNPVIKNEEYDKI